MPVVYRMNGSSQPDSEAVWADLQTGLKDVFQRNPMTPKRYMDLYSHVFNFCTANSSSASASAPRANVTSSRSRRGNQPSNAGGELATDFMGTGLYNKLKDFVDSYVISVLGKGVDKHGEDLLMFYTREWTEYRFSAKVVDGIFSYLNRHWIKREMDEGSEEVYVIYTLCLVLWKEALFGKLKERVTDAALELIRKERVGETIDRGLISGVVDSYVELGIDDEPNQIQTANTNANAARPEEQRDPKRLEVYRDHFETKFLAATENFYEIEAQEFMAGHPLTEYMKKVETRLKEEHNRCTLYLHRSTESKLAKRVEKVLIQTRLEQFQNEFGTLLENRMDDDLARMYKLCDRVEEGLANLRAALERHITKEGLMAVEKIEETGGNDAKIYVTTLLSVHQRYANLVEQAFKNEVGFLQSLDKAATTFVNKNAITQKKSSPVNPNKSPELLSRFCDQMLRKSNRMMDDAELEEMLCQVMIVFKYIEDKDIFSKFYTKMFSKRLITETSASEEAEMSFIGKLKHSCGFEYTNRMSKMISDVQISRELSNDFRTHCECQGNRIIDFNMLVLSTGSWPNMPQMSFHLPDKMTQTMELFNKFYDEKHNGRKLTWVFSQSRGELSSSAFGSKKIFTATTAQMAVLMLYNDALTYSSKAFADTLAMDKKTVAQTVASLVKAELVKGSDLDGRTEYDDGEEFTLNEKYSNKKVKVDLSKTVMRVDAKQENQEVSRNVDEDRKSVISACIVRIMKMRKTLNHQQLMAEVLQQLSTRFKPKVELVKRCIGMLMDKEYIKRSEEQRDVYEYIA